MNHKRWLPQMIGLMLVVLLLAACGPLQPAPTPIPPTPTPTPVPVSISGWAHSTEDPPQPAPDRGIVLCLVEEAFQEEGAMFVEASCVLDAKLTTVTDSEGRFEFRGMPDGSYMLLYDDTVENFDVGLQEWDGKVIKLLDEDWLGQFESEDGNLPTDEDIFAEILNLTSPLVATFLTTYVGAVEDFPFLTAIVIDQEQMVIAPVVVEVEGGEIAEVDIEVYGSRQRLF